MNYKYSHILTPVKIGNVTLKNHLLSAKCVSSQQTDFVAAGAFYESLAKNGAAAVTMAPGTFPNYQGKRSAMSRIHMDDPEVQHVYSEMINRVHSHGSLVSASLMNIEPQDVAISDVSNWDEIPKTGDYSAMFYRKPAISAESLEGMLQDFVFQCKEFKRIGFDMVTVYMSYRGSILACSLSPVLNQRTDKYGGRTMKERAALTLELFRRIKEACGKDFLIESQISAFEEAPGYTVADWLDYCKICEGLVDIFQVRGWDGSSVHGNGHNFIKGHPYALQFAEEFKKRNINILVSPVGGFGDLDDIERFIAEGKTDLVSIARAFIADENYGLKLFEGRGQEVVPCLLCNACHGSFCAVNPKAGYAHVIDTLYQKPESKKKVAVIGGGPAGMKAALIAVERGHQVTLFEKTKHLGGQLKHADYSTFKWPLKDYKDWLVRETNKSGIDVRLGTPATPDIIKAGKYDAIICALGSKPGTIPIKGADSPEVWDVESVYGHEAELGKRVVVVGGGMSGRETALYLAKCGHKVTMLTRNQAVLFEDMHSKRASEDDYKNEPNFSYIEYATTKEIGNGYVICDVKQGMPRTEQGFPGGGHGGPPPGSTQGGSTNASEPTGPPPEIGSVALGRRPRHMMRAMFAAPAASNQPVKFETRKLECDSVVVHGTRIPRIEEAKMFAGIAPQFFIIGDNEVASDVMDSTATAFAAAIQL